MAIKLVKYLVLNKYFLNLFGFNRFDDLKEKLRDTQEGYDTLGRSYFIDALIGLKPEWERELLNYDKAIKKYVEKLRRNRLQPNFNLKYFQYLAILFTEIFFNQYSNNRSFFLNELNEFIEKFNTENRTSINSFTEEDLRKLTFWMATGSGKTVIMHINYWQILKYLGNIWDNIILITPNEGLSRQHYEELNWSGIPAKLYDGNPDNLKTKDGEVLVIDIHKLTEEKKGEGKSVDISYFDGKNLVFIDEGHKGQKSDEQKWKKLREEIGKKGFIFEYSATFGQVIGKNKGLLEEYAKSIIFDYSYKYFYEDGYGKDFYVFNIKAKEKKTKGKTNREKIIYYYSEEQIDMLLAASLLSFYEQLIIFENHNKKLREYNVEKPLWIFVGSKVTGSGLNSDIIKILHFLNKLLEDESYLKEKVKKILKGKSKLIDKEGNDIFKGKFGYVKKFDIDTIIDGIYQKVFNGKGKLKLYEIKAAEGEIGLKTSTGEKYFGVINVGNVRELKNLIVDSDIEVEEDHMSQSLFFDINKNNSPINILIGSKKFIEGWNSWRVSVMGLINMGQSEGPQIIQLFGRGVRLKGKNYSLKREKHPDYKLKVLQTLFIFGLNADYINAFLKAIGNEGTDYEEISIPIKFNYPEKWEGKLYTIKATDFDFLEYPVKLTLDEDILGKVKIDLRPKITLAHGLETGSTDTILDEPIYISDEYLKLIDWEKIFLEIVNFKTVNGMFNLVLDRELLKQIIRSRNYEIYLPETEGIKVKSNGEEKPTLKLTSFQGLEKLHEIILMILKSYITKFYEREERKKSMDFLEPEPLTINNHLHMYPEEKEIIVKIPTKLTDEIKKLQEQIKEHFLGNLPESWKNWHSFAIHFDNHLYTPLIIWQKNQEEIKSIPAKLNEGETNFVKDLKDFIERNKNKLEGLEIFLLRNLSKKGVGFFIKSGFYPDFIIWIKNGNKQNIIFVDPKGIRNLGGFDNEKIQFCVRYIKEIEEKVREKIKHKDDQIFLDAFIVTVYSYKTTKDMYYGASREKFEEHNVLFQKDDRKYVEKIFRKVGVIERESLKFKL